MDHPIERPSFEEQIKDMFTAGDARCMGPRGVDLTTFDGVRLSSSKISDWIGSGKMPPPSSGRSWTAEQLKTFRNWGSNTGFAERAFVRLSPSTAPRKRRNLLEIKEGSDELDLLRKAFSGLMARDADPQNKTSFFALAGMHWLPGPAQDTFCRHHDDAYNPWHRAYLMAFEDALRSVEGCEDVTLPYWDILGDELPDWVFKPPFYKYALPYQVDGLDGSYSYPVGYETQRHDAATIAANIRNAAPNIEAKIGEALAGSQWHDFNGWRAGAPRHEGIIRAHDNGHGTCGPTIANQDVAAFDPLFWFFHCNWDRLWWRWQKDHNTQKLEDFQTVVSGDLHWLEDAPDTLLAPFDVNASEMINLADWNVDYDDPADEAPAFDGLVLAARGRIPAQAGFGLPVPDKVSVRIRDINRLSIPGSFEIRLMVGETLVDSTRIFQPRTPAACENCRKHGVFSTDFVVQRSALETGEMLRVAIFVDNPTGEPVEFPLSEAGQPTVNMRMLLQER